MPKLAEPKTAPVNRAEIRRNFARFVAELPPEYVADYYVDQNPSHLSQTVAFHSPLYAQQAAQRRGSVLSTQSQASSSVAVGTPTATHSDTPRPQPLRNPIHSGIDYSRFVAAFKIFKKKRGGVVLYFEGDELAHHLDKRHQDYAHFLVDLERQNTGLSLGLNQENVLFLEGQASLEDLIVFLRDHNHLHPILEKHFPPPIANTQLETLSNSFLAKQDGLDNEATLFQIQPIYYQKAESLRQLRRENLRLALKVDALRRSYKVIRSLKDRELDDNLRKQELTKALKRPPLTNQALSLLNLRNINFADLLPDGCAYASISLHNSSLGHISIINVIRGGGDIREINWQKSGLESDANSYFILQDMVQEALLLTHQKRCPYGIEKLFQEIIRPGKPIKDILDECFNLFKRRKSNSNFTLFCNYHLRWRLPETEQFYRRMHDRLSQALVDAHQKPVAAALDLANAQEKGAWHLKA